MKAFVRVAFVVALLASLPGCAATNLLSRFSGQQKFARATAKNPAVRCLCLWEPADGIGVDGKPARGVVGQILFFTRSSVASVEVDGDVRIFEFDDQGSTDEQGQPLHLFDFSAGAWNTYLTSTQFGPAYQLFVPYSRKGRHQADLALRLRLTPSNGPAVFSDLARVAMSGYEHSEAKGIAEADEPDAHNADDSDSHDGVTPKQVEQTLLKVLSEHRGQLNNKTGGEFNVSDEPNEALDPPVRVRLLRASRSIEEAEAGTVE